MCRYELNLILLQTNDYVAFKVAIPLSLLAQISTHTRENILLAKKAKTLRCVIAKFSVNGNNRLFKKNKINKITQMKCVIT